MKTYRDRVWVFGAALLGVLLLLSTGVTRGAEPPATEPSTTAAEEETPQKPPEKPPETPRFLPSGVLYTPYIPFNTLVAGPSTGITAPYGNAAATDSLARGWQTHRLGALRVTPFLGYDAIYCSNLFQTPNNKKADFANTISPGIRLELPVAQQHRLSLGYFANAFLYSRYGSQSHYDQNFNADAALNFPKMDVRFGSALRLATEQANTQIQQQRQYNRITPYFAAGYKFADVWRIEGTYQFDTLLFPKKDNQVDNYQDHLMTWSLFYKFWPKTAAFVQYSVDFRTHPNYPLNDNVTHFPSLGLQWDPTAKISGSVKVGYTVADYNHNTIERGNSTGGVAFSAQTIYKFSRYTNVALVAQRSIQENADNLNNGYYNSGLFLTVNHLFHYFQVSSYAAFAFYHNNYVGDTFNSGTGEFQHRVDNIVSAGVGLSRPVTNWLRLRLDYLYTNQSSNFSGLSYNQHFVSFGAQTSL
jgi:polysaccharide biosynthesis protein VpsM